MSADFPERGVEQRATKAGASFPRGFSRSGRLLKHSDFDRVYKQGRRHFSSHMTVFYLRQAEAVSPEGRLPGAFYRRSRRASGSRWARVLGGAVERNRIKRRLREAVRQRRAVLAGAGAVDVVINPKKVGADFGIFPGAGRSGTGAGSDREEAGGEMQSLALLP